MPADATIKAVFFDWFNTLAYCEPPREKIWWKICREMGHEIDEKPILRGILAADYALASPLKKHDGGDKMEIYREYPRLIFQEAGITAGDDMLKRALGMMQRYMGDFSYALFPDVTPVLKGLSARGLKVGVISNASNEMLKVYDEIGLSPLLDLTVTSEDAGASKPQPEIFRLALDKAGVSPAESIHVGDQYEMDTVGALGAGMGAVLIDRYDIFPEHDYRPRIRSLDELESLL